MNAAVPDLELNYRPMFGGILAYEHGRPLASLSEMGLALKMHGAGHTELLAIAGAEKLRYDANAPLSKTYVVVPDTMLTDPETLRGWTLRAIAGLPARKPKPEKKSPRR
jgi:TfoX/Sxy family transcriptional regulator of competence genes